VRGAHELEDKEEPDRRAASRVESGPSSSSSRAVVTRGGGPAGTSSAAACMQRCILQPLLCRPTMRSSRLPASARGMLQRLNGCPRAQHRKGRSSGGQSAPPRASQPRCSVGRWSSSSAGVPSAAGSTRLCSAARQARAGEVPSRREVQGRAARLRCLSHGAAPSAAPLVPLWAPSRLPRCSFRRRHRDARPLLLPSPLSRQSTSSVCMTAWSTLPLLPLSFKARAGTLHACPRPACRAPLLLRCLPRHRPSLARAAVAVASRAQGADMAPRRNFLPSSPRAVLRRHHAAAARQRALRRPCCRAAGMLNADAARCAAVSCGRCCGCTRR